MQAFLEALTYSAIIEANSADIATEVEAKFGFQVIRNKPMIIIMAPCDYWAWCLGIKKAGDWCRALMKAIGVGPDDPIVLADKIDHQIRY